MVLETYYYIYSSEGMAPGGVAKAVANTVLEGPNVAAGVAELAKQAWVDAGGAEEEAPEPKATYESMKIQALNTSGDVVADQFILYRYIGASGAQLGQADDSVWECITVEDGSGNAVIGEANYTQATGGSTITEGLPYVDFMVTATEGEKFEGAHTVRVEYDNDGESKDSWNPTGTLRFSRVTVRNE